MVILKKGEDVIHQYEKKFPFYYTKTELDQNISYGVIITDYFPIIEGKYKLVIILQNDINKELSYFEKKINIEPEKSSLPNVFGPIVSYQINHVERMAYSAFNIMGNNVKIDPRRTFGLKDAVYSLFCVNKGSYNQPFRVELEVESLDESRPYFKKYLLEFPEGKKFWCFSKYLKDLKYANYTLKAIVKDEKGIILGVKSKGFPGLTSFICTPSAPGFKDTQE